MVRGHPGLTPVVLPVLLLGSLTACSRVDFTADQSDHEAAAAVWSDPWLAPTYASVAGPGYGSNGLVERLVGRRTTAYRTDVETVAGHELRAAESAGWQPTSSTCGKEVQVALVGPTGALAQLVVTPQRGGATAAVAAFTPHHLDDPWDVAPADGTCLDDGGPPFSAPPASSEPTGPRATEEVGAEWERSEPSADEQELLDEVNADPALSALGVDMAPFDLREGLNRRNAPETELSLDVVTLGELQRLLPGWRLTFAACGAGGPVRATFLRDFEPGPVVVAAEVRRNGTTLRVTLPTPEAPPVDGLAELPPLEDPTCLADTVQRRLHHSGTPAVLPTRLTPIADRGDASH